ncbi:MAG: polyphosphate kinase 2 family protein [Methylocystis sp.]|nr:polyphosphate kinase 2 family protein [Methylocystis sp.]MCA3584460.1 polyphosphate kinase 2 family protein [Methylocystis sp.]MCA3588001.1 polyphosphate kinase 2 family protein [Methylocystis sp.]MCA3590518.1 polyphosphate kinase 2 family protein [Methylocystis sp.]
MPKEERPEISVKELLAPFRVTNSKNFRLKDHPTEDTRSDFDFDKMISAALLTDGVSDLQKLQDRLYADDRWSVLLIFQAMDGAGKDSTIKHVMSGVNPQGCQVHAFKRPSEEELDHDFLWRTNKALPERGRIGIFNRSYYEEVLVVRVHPAILKKQRIPDQFIDDRIWERRLKAIRQSERFLSRQGVKIIKFFLNVSKDEQKRRLIDRIDDPGKNWKFEADDLDERARWDDYMTAYEEAIQATATKQSPWYVIPADDKKFMRVAVMAAIRRELEKLDLVYPALSVEDQVTLGEARRRLLAERPAK